MYTFRNSSSNSKIFNNPTLLNLNVQEDRIHAFEFVVSFISTRINNRLSVNPVGWGYKGITKCEVARRYCLADKSCKVQETKKTTLSEQNLMGALLILCPYCYRDKNI